VVGLSLGIIVGVKDGLEVGVLLGVSLGVIVGVFDGLCVGVLVGVFDGDGVVHENSKYIPSIMAPYPAQKPDICILSSSNNVVLASYVCIYIFC